MEKDHSDEGIFGDKVRGVHTHKGRTFKSKQKPQMESGGIMASDDGGVMGGI
jgi:hypothetical protein